MTAVAAEQPVERVAPSFQRALEARSSTACETWPPFARRTARVANWPFCSLMRLVAGRQSI